MPWTLQSALQASRATRRKWIAEYLAQECIGHPRLSMIILNLKAEWEAPALLPICDLARGAGPSPSFKYPKDPDEWEQSIQEILADSPTRDSFPPAIVFRTSSGKLVLSDGNHRAAALERIGETHMWAFVCLTCPFENP